MRLFPSFVTLATALDAEEAAWVARWRRPPQSKKHHWHRLAGPIDVSCTFRYRLGLTKDAVGAAGPALDLRFDQHQRWLSEPHAPESAAFAATPRLCASAANQEALDGAPAHVMVTSSLAYLFRLWPYFANHVRFAKRRRRRFFVWIGELPEGLATTIGGACRRSAQGHVLLDQGMLPRDLQRRVLKSIYFQRESAQTIYNSNHYNKMPAVRERRVEDALGVRCLLQELRPLVGLGQQADCDEAVGARAHELVDVRRRARGDRAHRRLRAQEGRHRLLRPAAAVGYQRDPADFEAVHRQVGLRLRAEHLPRAGREIGAHRRQRHVARRAPRARRRVERRDRQLRVGVERRVEEHHQPVVLVEHRLDLRVALEPQRPLPRGEAG